MELLTQLENENSVIVQDDVKAQIDVLIASLQAIKATRATKKTIIGATTDPAGRTSLRALKNIANADLVTGANINALIGFTIDSIQADRDTDRYLVDAQRAIIRLSRIASGELESSNAGTPDETP